MDWTVHENLYYNYNYNNQSWERLLILHKMETTSSSTRKFKVNRITKNSLKWGQEERRLLNISIYLQDMPVKETSYNILATFP